MKISNTISNTIANTIANKRSSKLLLTGVTGLFSLGLAILASPAQATESCPTCTAAPNTNVVAATEGWSISGLLDVYYSYNFKNPPAAGSVSPASPTGPSGLPTGNNNLRFYDLYHDQISLQLAEVTVKKTGKSVSFLADFDLGSFADINAAIPSAASSGGPSFAQIDQSSKTIGQAYMTYTPSWAPNLTIDLGKMATHVGYETPKARDNFQYSRSTMFSFGMPLWHTGVHVGYNLIPNRLVVSGYVYNGWNNMNQINGGKNVGAQLKFTPSEALTLVYNFISGPEQQFQFGSNKSLHEFNGNYVVTPNLTLAFDLLWGQEEQVQLQSGALGKANWSGAALYSKHKVTPTYTISPRLEYFSDDQGYALGGSGQSLWSATLTQAFELQPGLETRVELRMDKSSSDQRFIGGDGTTSSQTTASWSMIYSF